MQRAHQYDALSAYKDDVRKRLLLTIIVIYIRKHCDRIILFTQLGVLDDAEGSSEQEMDGHWPRSCPAVF